MRTGRPAERSVRAVLAACAVLALAGARAEVVELEKRIGRTTVHYKVVLPEGYEPGRAYPAVLVFGGGPQTMPTIDNALSRNFRDEAEKRGYIIVAPAAPDGDLFFQRGDQIFPAFLDEILDDYAIEQRKFHAAGPSNGGIAAFHVAAAHPEYFLSVTAFPGYLWLPSARKLKAMANLCSFMYVGEHDEYRWHEEMEREAEYLSELGAVARYSLEAGQGHRLDTLAGERAARLFDGFDEAARGCRR